MSTMPVVTIAMPVYNGAGNLTPAVESLLAQTFGDFELVVSDNASTDATPDLAADFARHDPRVRYVRHAENIGANGNYSHLARIARGRYLKWASSSDWCAPTFIERCVEALEAAPDAVLAAPRTRLFVGDLTNAEDYAEDLRIPDEQPLERLHRLMAEIKLNNAINGLIRVNALRRTRLIERYYQADVVLMGHLAMLGKFLLIDEPLFYRRMEAATSTTLQDDSARRAHHYPTVTASTLFQRWKWHGGWVRAVLMAPMPGSQRVEAMRTVFRSAVWDREGLARDVRDAIRYATAPRSSLAEG
jgi:glycosyltransferase involved in cell wall biosynthesis